MAGGRLRPEEDGAPRPAAGERAVAYNAIECVIAIAAGLVAGSVALVGFGLDSIVEVPAA